ncbi:hypothetical protein [Lysinibacillus capsici]|uniref:hypothetical protein n=1 Tax=Lysinibacillus capsici TaxID=2115968 RepID=UPI00279AEE31|nr:hypothetical protein QIX46_23655 [Lysinibacillus boronitolerans]
MFLKKYPSKHSIKKVASEHINNDELKSFLKQRGIFSYCVKKGDLADILSSFYFNGNDYLELKKKMDIEQNYKKTGRISFPTEKKQDLIESLIELNNTTINESDNTRIAVTRDGSNNLRVTLSYDEYKPSLIDLLDVNRRNISIVLNQSEDNCSLDYDINSPNDYKKIKELLANIKVGLEEDAEIEFNEITLENLTNTQRIELFERFFHTIQTPWRLYELNKLKVKRNNDEQSVSTNNLQGINSAVLDGTNLKENQFVQSTLEQGFYFSMASMRLNKNDETNFIDLVIEFKSRPIMCEVRINNSGRYVLDNGEVKEVKIVLEEILQDSLLMGFKDELHKVYNEILCEAVTVLEVAAETEDI